jgi:hypothetical protein
MPRLENVTEITRLPRIETRSLWVIAAHLFHLRSLFWCKHSEALLSAGLPNCQYLLPLSVSEVKRSHSLPEGLTALHGRLHLTALLRCQHCQNLLLSFFPDSAHLCLLGIAQIEARSVGAFAKGVSGGGAVWLGIGRHGNTQK